MISRRNFFRWGAGSATMAGAGAVYGRFYGSAALQTTFKKIPLAGLREPIRVLHLSDFHASPEVSWDIIGESVEIGLSAKPDLVLLTGDFITSRRFDFTNYPSAITGLKDHPHCYACLGNHDNPYDDGGSVPTVARILEGRLNEVGVRLLHNATAEVVIKGSPIKVAGLGDLWSREVRPGDCLEFGSTSRLPTLLLAHNPDTKELLKNYSWDIMFSGHTHGGQLVIPILGWRPFLPVRDKTMAEGVHRWEGRHIHITRGVGNLHGMRINCPPEVSLIDLV